MSESPHLRNLPSDAKPFGKMIGLAYVPISRAAAELRSGARFVAGVDELGDVHFAMCSIEGLPLFALMQRDRPSHSGIDVLVDVQAPHPDGWGVLARQILGSSGLGEPDGTLVVEDE
ncbi:hypothetical protein B7486_54410 [cyanobacterium TDX16]|nr:hypothetical protein B7486_54410 [cyanobacterium TDX16]